MIRLAKEEDIPRLVDMGRRFRKETTYDKFLAENPEAMRKIGTQLLEKKGLLVSERDGLLTGMLGFVQYPHFLSGESISGEVFWWVEPEYRGDGLRLLREVEKISKERGAVRMQMIAPTEQVAMIYEHLKYEFVESAYQKDL